MATVAHYHYEIVVSDGFAPGDQRTTWFGPWDWDRYAVVFTARPFDRSDQDRTLTVSAISFRTTPDQYVLVTVRNVGRDTVIIYYLELALIGP